MLMVTLEPPRRLVAAEYRDIMSGGVTQLRLIVAGDEHGQSDRVVLKLRQPTPFVRNGHYAGTSLACELICAVLARALGLNVPDYVIVDVTRVFANSIFDGLTRDLLLNKIGPNFGSVYNASLALWDPRNRNRSQVFIDQLEDILTFDAVIINGDRQIRKPNLLYRGKQLTLIDHSLALPVHLWTQDILTTSPLFPRKSIMEHCASQLLKGKDRSYRKLLERKDRCSQVG